MIRHSYQLNFQSQNFISHIGAESASVVFHFCKISCSQRPLFISNQTIFFSIFSDKRPEQSIASARASVMIYDDMNKKWIPSGSSHGLSKVHIYHHFINNTFRVVGRKLQDHEVRSNLFSTFLTFCPKAVRTMVVLTAGFNQLPPIS